MKKSVISLSIAAMIGGLGFAGVASAATSTAGTGTPLAAPNATVATSFATLTATTATTLQFAEGGIGHMLLVPYFTTQGGNVTLLNITNTDTVNGKAVKVRFRGAGNSDDILDFQVLMSPGDVWTAEITQDGATGLSRLTTADTTCTIPEIPAAGVSFKTNRVAPQDPTFTDAMRAAHTREGYIEIFNMVDIPPLYWASAAATAPSSNPLYTAIKHVNGVPANCDAPAVQALYTGNAPGSEAALQLLGFNTPTTGLYGTSTLVNTTSGFVAWSTNADAIEAVATAGGPAVRGRAVYAQQLGVAVDNVAGARFLTNDPLLRLNVSVPGAIQSLEFDFPDMSTPYVGTGPTLINTTGANIASPENQTAILTTAIAKNRVVNEYLTNPAIAARTDWTFTMPTRRYHVATAYRNDGGGAGTVAAPMAVFHGTNATTETEVTPSTWFTSGNTTMGTAAGGAYSLLCVSPGGTNPVVYFDHEERTTSAKPDFSPDDGQALRFCAEASVLSFNHASEVLYAEVGVRQMNLNYTDGWAVISTPGLVGGLPLLGASYTRVVGAEQAGKMTNYGLVQPHRY